VSHSFEIGPVRVGEGQLFLIAGPCVIESEAHARKMAEAIQRITSDLGVPCIFKASYDKANRTSVKSFRGPGLIEGTKILGRLAKDTGLPVLTDVHEPDHCNVAAEAVDVLQIPAFLCRQTDLLVSAGKTGRAVNIKKGQFVAPWDMKHPVEKVRSTGNERVFLTERGASFGYNTLVVDYRSLPVMKTMASAAASRSSSPCSRVQQLRRASMDCFSKSMTTQPTPNQTAQTPSASICLSNCSKPCWQSTRRQKTPDPRHQYWSESEPLYP